LNKNLCFNFLSKSSQKFSHCKKYSARWYRW